MIPLSILFLSTSCLEPPSSHLELSVVPPTFEQNAQDFFHRVADGAIYFSAGTVAGSVSLATRLGWEICRHSPWALTPGKECLLLSQLCGNMAWRFFAQAMEGVPSFRMFLKTIPFSQSSWYLNKALLAQIPAFSEEEQKLLLFLEKRWLAKSTGYYASLIDWICPCFGIRVQVHPETTSSYARDPGNKLSQTYKNNVTAWKAKLPHPENFPLILTRPANVQEYLPHCFSVFNDATIHKLPLDASPLVLDLTELFEKKPPESWMAIWNSYQTSLLKTCKEQQLDPKRLLCIQRVYHEEMGGIRLFPLLGTETERHYDYLLTWISKCGLSANRIELDRCSFATLPMRHTLVSAASPSKEEFLSHLFSIEKKWDATNPQKTLLFQGTIHTLKGLLASLSQKQWEAALRSPTRSSLLELCFSRIEEQLHLAEEKPKETFFETASHMEQALSDLSSLLEIFHPFQQEDFPLIYRKLLTSIPHSLKPLTSYGIHSSGMTSLTGIFKAVERSIGKKPRILYGENTYFENIYTSEWIGHATSVEEASAQDWEEVDLILAQFNPVLKRIDFEVTDYKAEKISETLHQALNTHREKPLTLALDCTLDYIDSPRVKELLAEFQEEILKGQLNIISYRSGLKFDLLGMDNYCGAPFYIIHNGDAKWSAFNALLTDPALQTDPLSLNWFCLAYQTIAPQLEDYRRQVFANTRALLNKVPKRLFEKNNAYRIIPVEEGADPGFIDIKISGPLHPFKGSFLVGGYLATKCMEQGHPVFARPSIGFYHPNLSILFSEKCTTIRLTLGLDPAQVDVLARCFEAIDGLNGPEQ